MLAYTFRLAFFFVLVFVFMFSLEIIKTQDFEWKICWKNNCLYSYVFRNEDIWKMNEVAVNAPSDECCSAIKNWTPKHRIKLMSLGMILHLCRLQKLTKWVWLAGFCFQFQFGDCQYLEMNGNKLKKNENSEVFPLLVAVRSSSKERKCWHKFTHEFMKLRRFFLFEKMDFCFAFRSALVFQSFCGPKRVPMQWQRIYMNSSNSTKRSWLILIYDTISIIQKHCHSLLLRILNTE